MRWSLSAYSSNERGCNTVFRFFRQNGTFFREMSFATIFFQILSLLSLLKDEMSRCVSVGTQEVIQRLLIKASMYLFLWITIYYSCYCNISRIVRPFLQCKVIELNLSKQIKAILLLLNSFHHQFFPQVNVKNAISPF